MGLDELLNICGMLNRRDYSAHDFWETKNEEAKSQEGEGKGSKRRVNRGSVCALACYSLCN